MINLDGKSALVTGSTSGIGLAIATGLAKAGANVMLNGFGKSTEIEKLRSNLATITRRTILYSPADMRTPSDIENMINTAQEKFGSVDILVNNAGTQHVSPLEDFPPEKWDMIIAINLSSAFHTMRLCMAGMKKVRWGRMLNIASAHSLVASPYKSAYVAAKHGLVGLTKTAALECAQDGVTVNAISPGYVLTPLVEAQIPDTAKARGISVEAVKRDILLASHPTKKFVSVDQITQSALYLCSDAAENITGTNLSIDGGWTAQ